MYYDKYEAFLLPKLGSRTKTYLLLKGIIKVGIANVTQPNIKGIKYSNKEHSSHSLYEYQRRLIHKFLSLYHVTPINISVFIREVHPDIKQLVPEFWYQSLDTGPNFG